MIRRALSSLLVVVASCGEDERVVVHDAEPENEGVRVTSGAIEFVDGSIVDAIEIAPERPRPGDLVEVRFRTTGLAGAKALVYLEAGRAAAREEVRHDGGGRPADPRTRVHSLELSSRPSGPESGDGLERVSFEVPSGIHSGSAVIALEVSRSGRDLVVARGPRSEMMGDGRRVEGGRAILALLEIEPTPLVIEVPRTRPGEVELDGSLVEEAFTGEGVALAWAIDGEPVTPAELEAQFGVTEPTRVWFSYDEDALHVAADLPDADLWADQREQDDHLWERENFEVFLAASKRSERYIELQVSPRNVTFDAKFERQRKGDFAWDSRWQTAVQLRGTLEGGDRDLGWSVEAAIPWSEICDVTGLSCPVGPGTRLHVNAFRIERPRRKEALGLGLSPTRGDFHDFSGSAILELADRRREE